MVYVWLNVDQDPAKVAFQSQALMVGRMHFMDSYNFDCERVRRCGIHYATPDGRIIPFCSYNSIHREEVRRCLLEDWRSGLRTQHDPGGKGRKHVQHV